MLELWQTEWLPGLTAPAQRLTELGVDYLIRQVPVEREQRHVLRAATGTETIPALTLEDGTVLLGEETIAGWLEANLAEPVEAEAHKLKAAKARRR